MMSSIRPGPESSRGRPVTNRLRMRYNICVDRLLGFFEFESAVLAQALDCLDLSLGAQRLEHVRGQC